MTTVVDGNSIQTDIKHTLRKAVTASNDVPRLDIMHTQGSKLTRTFTTLKQEFGTAIGAEVHVQPLPEAIDTEEICSRIDSFAKEQSTDGIVVQLPLPSSVDASRVLNAIPSYKDVDVLSSTARSKFRANEFPVLPPVVGAIQEICDRYSVDLNNADTVVVGHGRLVGQPTATWLANNFKSPIVLDEGDNYDRLKKADAIITGAGDPHIIRPHHITEGVVLIDAGTTSTEEGTQGDIDPACKDKARLFTPVPGGVGPVTVAKLFQNLITLAAKN